VPILNPIRLLSFVVCCLALRPCAAAEPTPAPAPARVALVIGNGRYEPAVGPLRNTANDARAMAKALRSLGFTVIEAQNVTRDELMAAVLKFRGQLRGAEVGLFYFAGHGISVAGANYLLPIKSSYAPEAIADGDRRLLAETKLFNAEQVVTEMVNSGVRCNLVILDACRTTPVARNPANRDATKSGGLVEMNPPAGSLIAFATDAGRAASDGEGTNGLYTSELITHLLTPGLTIEQVFKRTRKGVMERSNGAQLPAEYSRLVGDDIFLAGRTVKTDDESIPKGEPVRVPTLAEINKLAARGDTVACLEALRRSARQRGTLDAAPPLAALLDHIKETLRAPKVTAPQAAAVLQSCEQILAALEVLLPADHPQRATLTAQAQNRRGDALLLLAKPEDALAAFNTALTLTPDDAYVLYNRGTALLALGRTDEARTDFTTVAAPTTKQPGARKLAAAALAKMK
jgi:tetratricopeptide (TPR) repeat protein